MGHQNDAIAALRAYARDLENTASGGAIGRVGGSDQVDAPAGKPASGAPHQLAIAAVAVCVVLIGSIAAGYVGLRGSQSIHGPLASAISDDTPASPEVLYANSPQFAQAVLAFNTRGMSRSAAALEAAGQAGVTDDPVFVAALSEVRRIMDELFVLGTMADEDVEPLATAVGALESVVRPPGLDPEFTPPGQGGTPPGLDPEFTPPGQDPEFTPPGQDPEFTPPGQDTEFTPPGQDTEFTPPGKTKPKESVQPGKPDKNQPDRGDS